MREDKLFKKYYKSEYHNYELPETMDHTDDEGRSPDIAFIYSGRNRGKSYEVTMRLLCDAWYRDRTFIYVRRHVATAFQIESYFADKLDLIHDMTDGLADGIMAKRGQLFFYKIVETNDGKAKREEVKRVGYYMPLSGQGNHKSEHFPDCYNILYEEVLTTDPYLPAEPDLMLNLISTAQRNKEDFHTYLISNTVTIVNPYSKAWGLQFGRTKPGEVRLTKLYLRAYDENGNEKYYLIAGHYLKDQAALTKEDLAKKRNRVKTSIASNEWDEARLYTTIDLSFIKSLNVEPLDTVVFEWDDVLMQGDILELPTNVRNMYLYEEDPEETTMPVLYIRRKTSEPFRTTRVYSNNSERFNEYTSRGFKKIYKLDLVIEQIMLRGWFMGADNLTMNDFDAIWKKLKLFN